MIKQSFITGLALATLMSCGEDISSNRRAGALERRTPGLTPDVMIPAHVHRTRGLNILNSQEFIQRTLNDTLNPDSYRIVPNIMIDDESTGAVTVQRNARPSQPCGADADLITLNQKISDCSAKNGSRATWSAINGIAGEANWNLVSLTSTGQEIWLDNRTGLVWSDAIAMEPWCEAAGVTTAPCEGAESVCAGKPVVPVAGITWRLPTRNDYLQADLDGLRFVLKKGGEAGFWTATLVSPATATETARTRAWVYHDNQGTLESATLITEKEVRCIGVAPR